jgi:formylglycine-generating enzyme required for sulfatase activity
MSWQQETRVKSAVVGALVLGATVASAGSPPGPPASSSTPAARHSAPPGRSRAITVLLPGKVPLVLVRVPAGTFTMGSPVSERGRGDAETPHQVKLTREHVIGQAEVTQAQWQALMGSNPSYFSYGGDSPVEQVSWDDITGPDGFLARLNRHLASTSQFGAGRMRLPTEAEWERAARGGTTTRFSHGDALGCDDLCGPCPTHLRYMKWCGNNDSGRAEPIAGRRPNPFGLFDAHGNAREWVQDWYGEYAATPQIDPTGPPSGSHRVVRGGRNDSGAKYCRSAVRDFEAPDFRDAHTGFRVAGFL